MSLFIFIFFRWEDSFSAQSSLSIFTQKYLRKCEDTYFILHNKYLRIYKDSFRAKRLRDDYALRCIDYQVVHKIHKSTYGLCFWSSDPLIDRFYINLLIKVSEAQKQRPHELL